MKYIKLLFFSLVVSSCTYSSNNDRRINVFPLMINDLESILGDSVLKEMCQEFEIDKEVATDKYAFLIGRGYGEIDHNPKYKILIDSLFGDQSSFLSAFFFSGLYAHEKSGLVNLDEAVTEAKEIENSRILSYLLKEDEIKVKVAEMQDLLIYEGDQISFNMEVSKLFTKNRICYGLSTLKSLHKDEIIEIEGTLVKKRLSYNPSLEPPFHKEVLYDVRISSLSRSDVWIEDSLLKSGMVFTLNLTSFGLPIKRLLE